MATYEVKIYEILSHNLEVKADSEQEAYDIAFRGVTDIVDAILDERVVDAYHESEGFSSNYSVVKVSD